MGITLFWPQKCIALELDHVVVEKTPGCILLCYSPFPFLISFAGTLSVRLREEMGQGRGSPAGSLESGKSDCPLHEVPVEVLCEEPFCLNATGPTVGVLLGYWISASIYKLAGFISHSGSQPCVTRAFLDCNSHKPLLLAGFCELQFKNTWVVKAGNY